MKIANVKPTFKIIRKSDYSGAHCADIEEVAISNKQSRLTNSKHDNIQVWLKTKKKKSSQTKDQPKEQKKEDLDQPSITDFYV